MTTAMCARLTGKKGFGGKASKASKRAWVQLLLMLLVGSAVMLFAAELFAAGSGMPWESTLNKVLASLQGPVARFVGIVAILITGLAFALGEGGGFFKQGLAVAFGLSIAFGATTFITEFGFAGGALI